MTCSYGEGTCQFTLHLRTNILIYLFSQLKYANEVRYAKSQFFFGLDLDGETKYFALALVFGHPDKGLRALSKNALLVCTYDAESQESLAIVPVQDVISVVGMVPFVHDVDRDDQYFAVEKIGHVTGDESPQDAPDEEEDDQDI